MKQRLWILRYRYRQTNHDEIIEVPDETTAREVAAGASSARR